jgi:MFS family permease
VTLESRAMYRIVAPLALVETLVWAFTFYMFPAMLQTWEADPGWSKTQLSAAFTLALLLSALVAPGVGRLIDINHGRATMAFSVGLAGLMMILLSMVQAPWQFLLVWAGLGIAMGGALYEACFAFVTHLLGDAARRAITTITLVAGLAGTVSFPLTYWLNQLVGWRTTLVIYAVVMLLLVLPLVMTLPRGCAAPSSPSSPMTRTYSVRGALATPMFWLLAIGFALIALEHGILITHLLPILADRGFSSSHGVLAAAMIGPMQVVGRLGMIAVQGRLTLLSIALLSVASLALAAVSIFLSAFVAVFAVLFVLLQGAGNGMTSIARPVLTAECLGRANFGAISGLVALLFMLMMALSPSLASLLWRIGGYDLVIGFVLMCCIASLGCLWSIHRMRRRQG